MAAQCCEAIKEQLSISRNIKREIRKEIESRVDQLEKIIRAYEEDRKGSIKEQGIRTPDVQDKSTDILKKIEENERLLKENGRVVLEIKEKIDRKEEREKEREIQGPTTCARLVSGLSGTQLPERGTLHSVVVTSKNEQDTGEQVMERLRKVANEDEGWVKVEKVKRAKDRKVIIGYRTEEERNRAQKRLAEKEKSLNVEEVRNKDPLLVLYNVLKNLKDEDLLNAIRTRNKDLFQNLEPDQDRMSVFYKRTARNPHTCHVVLRVSPAVWSRALNGGRLHVDLQPIRVADQSPLVQCSLCLGYGHSRRFCTTTEPRCSHCGGLHMRAECPDYAAGAEPNCCNCQKERLSSIGHNVFNDVCPIRKKWETIARATTQYRC